MKEKKSKENREKNNRFLQIIKKKWLINGTTTFALVVIIIMLFIVINMGIQNLELIPIDLSQEQLYTLTDESKEKVKNIDKTVNIYFVGYNNDDSVVDLAKQYKKFNEKIIAQAVDATSRPDLAEKYGIDSGAEGIIVECGEKSKVLTSSDLVTYDMTTYETISIAEEKLTSSIMSVVTDEVPKIYFLEGYSDFSLANNMNYLSIYLANEVNEIDILDILTEGKVPDDCDTLIISTPKKDFDDIATNAIIDYINSGRNILWLNSAVTSKQDFPNVNKILALYGIKPFEVGIILETDASKMLSETPNITIPNVEYSTVTKDLVTSTGVLFINATKINFVDDEQLEKLNVEKIELLNSSEKSFFRTNIANGSVNKSTGEEEGEFVVGAELNKTISVADEETGKQAVVSKMIIFGENYFITDYPIGNSSMPVLQLADNKDLILNSMAYLVDREEDITARKSTGTVTYTATEQENTIIKIVIFAVPTLIIIVGLVVWIVRKRRK